MLDLTHSKRHLERMSIYHILIYSGQRLEAREASLRLSTLSTTPPAAFMPDAENQDTAELDLENSVTRFI